MLDNFTTFLPSALLSIILSTIVSWLTLKTICLAKKDFLGFLYISSGKSATNARLLGGLSISASLLTTLLTIISFYPENLSLLETKMFVSAIVSILLVSIYGYIDDKFEVRVRFKLTLQLTAVLSFAYFSAPNLSPDHPTMAFIFSSVLGLALVNGTNLLDGLDTLSIKLGTSSSLSFLYLGIISHSSATIFLSLILLSSFSVFYFFNREPAKIYMGEIGGSLIGLIYFIQSSISFTYLKSQMTPINALSMVLIAGSFPICELGISFLRRIMCKKTPFRGDRLHMHYILRNTYHLSASTTSTRMGLTSLIILVFGYSLAQSYGALVGLAVVLTITIQSYLSVCHKEWRLTIEKENSENLFKIFEGKTINVIDSTQFSSLDVGINDEKVVNKKKSA